ncbi:MAG TPA: hypothetical protein PLW37_04535 [bacterium]|nr:hypothetical protein [bacterium]
MKHFYDVYIRQATGTGIKDLNDVLDGENSFIRFGLVDELPKIVIDKKETKVLNQGKEHVFTEQVTSEAISFNVKEGNAGVAYVKFNNKLVDVCLKSTQLGSTSPFIEGTKATIKIEMMSRELSKVTISTAIETEDASDVISFYEVA